MIIEALPIISFIGLAMIKRHINKHTIDKAMVKIKDERLEKYVTANISEAIALTVLGFLFSMIVLFTLVKPLLILFGFVS